MIGNKSAKVFSAEMHDKEVKYVPFAFVYCRNPFMFSTIQEIQSHWTVLTSIWCDFWIFRKIKYGLLVRILLSLILDIHRFLKLDGLGA